MKNYLKHLLFFVTFCFTFFNVYASPKQSSQVIKSGHWIYDDLTLLATEAKTTSFLETQPLTIGEIRFILKYIDYDSLSSSGKVVYDKVNNYINDDDDFLPNSSLRLFINIRTNPEFMYKSNPDIPWSFAPNHNYKDNPVTFPIIIGFSDYFTIQSDLGFGPSLNYSKKSDNFMNIPIDLAGYDFFLPKFAYFSGTKVFDDWGISAHMGKQGMRIGNSNLGSIIYNDTFNSDFYCQLNFFTKYIRFSMDVTQFSHNKYMYLHHLSLQPFKNFYVSVVEGSLNQAPFELRFLNPLMLMHQFGAWIDYDKDLNQFYSESKFCAYLGFTFEYLPIKNLRLYGMYAQNEILDFGDPKTPENLCFPDSLGGQFGIEYNIPLDNLSHIKTNIEAVYTSPYLYVKHGPGWSLIKSGQGGDDDFMNWLGSPTGPDSFILQTSAEYDSNSKWSAGLKYKMTIHGENTAKNLFNRNKYYYKDNPEGKEYWHYYPSVKFENAKNQEELDAAVADARNMWMHGIIQYTHEISIDGHYNLLPNLQFSSHLGYTFVFNNDNKLDNFAHGVELGFIVTYELF